MAGFATTEASDPRMTAASPHSPVVLLASPAAALVDLLEACCAFIGARVEPVLPADLAAVMDREEPIAVVATFGTAGEAEGLLAMLAHADAELPVLLVTEEAELARRAVRARAARCGLRHASISAGMPRPTALVSFLVEAGIQRGWVGLLPR